MEKISVIVPVYKIKEQYLKECIESISKQTYSNLEIILVDDGSPDQKNQGVSMARNNAIQKATGEWIAFIDADDWIEKNMCELAMEKRDGNDMVVWNMYLNKDANQQIKKNYEKDLSVDDEKLLEKINLNFLRTISLSKDEIRIPTL